MSVRASCRLAVLVATFAFSSASLEAQHLSGIVTDSASREPVPSAVVRLFSPSGQELERTVTGRDGRYRLDALPASRELRVVRIGFRPRTIAFAGGVNDTSVDIAVVPLPTLLAAVDVNDQPQCSRRSDRAAALALWEQARAALLATIVAREARPPSVIALIYDRTLDRRGRIVRQTVRHDSVPSNRPFIAARPTSEFRDLGYAEGTPNQRVYLAPDADILLDQSFGDGHCFSVRDDKRGHPGQIGLAFEPARDRDGVVDIDGVMWFDVATPALRTVEFRYTNVEPAVAAADAGGRLSFHTASNGLSLIDSWSLRIPSLVHDVAGPRRVEVSTAGTRVGDYAKSGTADQPTWRVLDIHVTGAVIGAAVWPDSSEWHSALGTLHGRAVRPGSGDAVAGATVRLIGSDDSTRTAADGSFSLAQLLPGPYRVFAAEPPADGLGFLQIDSLRIDVDSSSMPPMTVTIPTLTDRIRAFCGGSTSGPTRTSLALGVVLLPDGSKASGASVDAFWDASEMETGRAYRIRARTDTSGAFHACGLRGGDTVKVMTTLDSLDASATDAFRVRSDAMLSGWAIHLDVPAYRSRIARIVDEQTGEPIAGATLLDDDSGDVRATTNAAGEAGLSWLPRGRSSVPVQARGYVSGRVTVVVEPNDTTTVRVALRSRQ